MEAFNRLSTESYLAHVPAVLLASPKQPQVVAAAKVDGRRRILPLPLQASDLTKVLGEILPPKA